MKERSGTDDKFIKQSRNTICIELQANNNCSKSSLFIVTECKCTWHETFDTAIDIGSKFQMNSSFELQYNHNWYKDAGNEFSINKLRIFSTSLFIPLIVKTFNLGSLYFERN